MGQINKNLFIKGPGVSVEEEIDLTGLKLVRKEFF
jgi:hypothetical protein